MSVDPADRTATLAPRTASPQPRPLHAVPAPPIPSGDDPDRYDPVAEHARGGLGRIVRAFDRRLGRTVAVKELLCHDEQHQAQFMREALITARLEHPGIVAVHEAGRWPNGAPYYVMKLVEGRTLKELLAETPQLRGRLGLLPNLIALADAVGYAHSKGVIHRDLKPSNVIIGSFGETIVVDWGLARDLRSDMAGPVAELAVSRREGASTISGNVVGTPAYMAPEQARGEDVDAHADVYALGAVLYELLAGKAPHADVTPQAVLDRVIAGPPPPLQAVASSAPDELVDIVAKAMARQPAERYPNATALAEDLRRFQTGKLVSAHAYTSWQLLRKRLAQHRSVVAMAIACLVALGAIGVESFRTVVAERDIARSARAHAEDRERELVLTQAQTSLRKDPTATLAWLKRYPIGDRDRSEVVDVIDEAQALGVAAHVFRSSDWVFDAAFTPDGRTVVAAVRDGSVCAFDVATGAKRLLGHAATALNTLAIAPDGRTVVTGGMLGEVIAWPFHGGHPTTLVDRGRPVIALRFDPSGARVLVGRDSGPADIITLGGATEHVGADSVMHVAVAAEDWSRRVAVVAPNQLAVIEAGATRVIAQTKRAIYSVALSPDGAMAVIYDGDTVWTVPTAGGALVKLADYHGKLTQIVWSNDRRQLAIAGHLPEVTIVALATGAVTVLRGHSDAIYTVEFTRDGRALLTASDDGTARLWDLGDGSSTVLRGHDDDVYRARLSPDEHLAVTSSLDGSIRLWPIARGGTQLLSEGSPIEDLTVDARAVLFRSSSSVARWDLATGVRHELFSWAGDPRALGQGLPSPDGTRLLVPVGEFAYEVRRRDAPPVVLRGHRGLVNHVEWGHDSQTVYSSSSDGTLVRWDAATGASTVLLHGAIPVRGFGVAADGRVAAQVGETLVMVAADGTVETLGSGRKWCAMMIQFEAVRDRLLVQRCDHGVMLVDGKRPIEMSSDGWYGATRIAVSPDGERIAGAMGDRSVRVWDATTGRELLVLKGHSDLVMDVAFSPDGTRLASASYDRTVRVWQLATGGHRVLRGHTGPVNRVAWRTATELVTASDDGTLRRWPAPSAELPTLRDIAQRLDAATTARIDGQNRATTGG